MERTPVNPWTWSLEFGFSQAELVEGRTRTLFCSGQTSADAEGRPQHAGDMPAQIGAALDNLEAVLGAAGMTLSNVVGVNFYTTDVDAFLQSGAVLGERLGAAGIASRDALGGLPTGFTGADDGAGGDSSRLDQPSLRRPAGQLVTAGKLELPQHR